MPDGALKVRIAAPPERGRANDELCALLARHFSVPVSAVEVVAGHTSTRKIVRVNA